MFWGLELIEDLDDADRQTLLNVIDSMLTKHRMLQLLESSRHQAGR